MKFRLRVGAAARYPDSDRRGLKPHRVQKFLNMAYVDTRFKKMRGSTLHGNVEFVEAVTIEFRVVGREATEGDGGRSSVFAEPSHDRVDRNLAGGLFWEAVGASGDARERDVPHTVFDAELQRGAVR